MIQAALFLGSAKVMREAYFTDLTTFVNENFPAEYTFSGQIEVDVSGADACEEWFDLTNNPYRQDERVEKYGHGRSVSVGDVVKVHNHMYVCAPQGWVELT